MNLQKFRTTQLRNLPYEFGVYALCDLDNVPIYVGQSVGDQERIRGRVRRHLTSARSDQVANRQIDVWEVAFVWTWSIEVEHVNILEAHLYHRFNNESRLMNGHVPPDPGRLRFQEPQCHVVQVLPDDEIKLRKQPEHRLPRQIVQFNQLMDYILIVKDEEHLRAALAAHFERLERYYRAFLGTEPVISEKKEPDK